MKDENKIEENIFTEKIIKPEVLFKSIFNFSPDAIIIINSEGTILQANEQAEKLFGYAGKELINKSVDILIPERFRKRHDEHLKHFIEKPHIRFMGFELGLYGLRKDGTEFPIDIALGFLETKGGIIVLSTIHDMTEHKRIEDALRVSEAKYRGIFDHAAEGIFQTTIDGRIISANKAYVRILGYDSAEELIASVTDVRKLYAEPGRRLHFIRLIRAEGAVSDFEALINRKDRRKIWVSINAHTMVDSTGKVTGIEGMVMDITNRKRAQKNFQMLIDGSPDAIIAVDRNFNILLTNTRTEKLFGYLRLELIGNSYEILLPDRFRYNHAKYCSEYFDNPSTRIMALHMSAFAKRRTGSEFPVEVNMSPVETDEGIVVIIDVRDITEKEKIQG